MRSDEGSGMGQPRFKCDDIVLVAGFRNNKYKIVGIERVASCPRDGTDDPDTYRYQVKHTLSVLSNSTRDPLEGSYLEGLLTLVASSAE